MLIKTVIDLKIGYNMDIKHSIKATEAAEVLLEELKTLKSTGNQLASLLLSSDIDNVTALIYRLKLIRQVKTLERDESEAELDDEFFKKAKLTKAGQSLLETLRENNRQ